jgi:hypothetical protein
MSVWIWLRAEWDRVLGFTFAILGALLLFLGYQGMKDTPFVADQLTYIATGGLGGLCCVAFGAAMLISADLHDEWRKLDRIEAAIRGDAVCTADQALDLVNNVERLPAAPAETLPAGANRAVTLALAFDWKRDGLRRYLLLAITMLVVPLFLMTAGWRTAAQTADFDRAATGVGVVMVGVMLTVAIGGVYTAALRARVNRRQLNVLRPYVLRAPGTERPSPVDALAVSDEDVLIANGSHRIHRAGCPALQGLTVAPARRSGLGPDSSVCGLCHTP